MRSAAARIEALDAQLAQARETLGKRLWKALQSRCCSDPGKAKRIVMLSREDLRAALAAIDAQTPVIFPPEAR